MRIVFVFIEQQIYVILFYTGLVLTYQVLQRWKGIWRSITARIQVKYVVRLFEVVVFTLMERAFFYIPEFLQPAVAWALDLLFCLALHKKWSFPLSISTVNVTKSPVYLVTLTEEIFNGKLHLFCGVNNYMLQKLEQVSFMLHGVTQSIFMMTFTVTIPNRILHSKVTNKNTRLIC